MLTILVVALCTLPPLLIGGVHRITLIGTSAVALLALLALLLGPRLTRPVEPLGLLGAALLAGLALTCLQRLPLPLFLRQLLSPHGVELMSNLGHDVRPLLPLTLDPAGTLYALARGFCVVTVFLCVRQLAVHRRASTAIVTAIVASTVVAALVGGLQRAMSLRKVYGLYQPRWTIDGVLGTFVNNNHNAGFYLMGALLAGGLALQARRPERRWLAMGVAAGLGMMVALSTSRGGLLGLVVGGLVLLGRLVAKPAGRDGHEDADEPRPEARGDRLRQILPLAATSLVIVGIIGTQAYSGVTRRLQADLSNRSVFMKPVVWRDALPLIGEHLVTGVGRGAWQSVYPRYKTAPFDLSFTHPENQVVQLVSEQGLPGAAMIVLFVAGFLVALRRTPPRSLAAGAAAALVGLGTQSLFDFGLETPGLAIPAAAVLAILMTRRPRHEGPAEPLPATPATTSAPPALLPMTLLVLGVVTTLLLASRSGRQLIEDDESISRRTADPAVSTDALEAEVREALHRHPVDYQLHAALAYRLIRERSPAAVSWLNRALWAAPRDPRLHAAAGRLLLQRGRAQQAALEYRLALRDAHDSYEAMVRELCRVLRAPDLIARALPDTPAALDDGVAMLQSLNQAEPARQLAELAHARFPADSRAPDRLAALSRNTEEKLRWARARVTASTDEAGVLLLARALVEAERHQEAEQVLQRLTEREGQANVDVLLALADARSRMGAVEKARQALAGPLESLDVRVQIRALRRLAEIEARAKNQARAQVARDRANQLEGSR